MWLAVVLLGVVATAQPGVQYCHANSSFVDNSHSGFTLHRLVLVTRHGDRVPVNAFPVVPGDSVVWNCSLKLQVADDVSDSGPAPRVLRKRYMRGRNLLLGNCEMGQLTDRGAQEHQELGTNLRSLYVKSLGFLPSRADWNDMHLRSTDFQRTLLSAFNLLQGLYPADEKPLALNIDTADQASDNAWPNTISCPALQQVFTKVQQSATYNDYYSNTLLPLAKKWGAAWNMTLAVTDMQNLNDIMRARYCHNYPLFPNVTLADARVLFEGVRVLDNMVTAPFAARKFGSGSFLADLYEAMTVRRERFSLFSAHDDTCRSLLFSLVLGETPFTAWPGYASHIALEVWHDSADDAFVVMQYNGATVQMLPPCKSTFCALGDFERLVQSYAVAPGECGVASNRKR